MATILEQYRKRQNDIREQIAANSLPLDQVLIMQELNYRICVLETFESLCKSAPVTMDTKSMGFHFQLVDAYVRFTLMSASSALRRMPKGRKSVKPHCNPLYRWCRTDASAFPALRHLRRSSTKPASTITSKRFCPSGCSIATPISISKEAF